ncbi:type II toxin-antitoxin system HipA family toxin [Tistrella mobilis]|uniref:type II toxin-antitoxin system HipA family toxin n=1 Tax=Tistrella mobilis TaxID=171437 RepID=UPI00355874CF
MSDLAVLDVRLHGRRIGSLTRLGGDRTIFAFDQDYVADPARPTLSLSFKDAFGSLITNIPPTQRRLPPFFANLLPEGVLRDYLARRAGVHPDREFFLLRALGQDLAGAVSIVPADPDAGQPWTGQAEDAAGCRDPAGVLRFSLAGVQLKFSAVHRAGKNGGLAIPARGIGGEWIVKLPLTRFEGVPENEFAMMSLARDLGIDVPEIRLIDLDGIDGLPQDLGRIRGQGFAIRRFDRTAAGAVHIEDFAQIFGVYPETKYKSASLRNILQVLATESDVEVAADFVRRLVFSVLIGNADMHLKNWSVIYADKRTARLAPAYDMLSTIPYMPDENFALKFARVKRFDAFTWEELDRMAEKAGLPSHQLQQIARETVGRFLDLWQAEKSHLPVASHVVSAIDRHLTGLAIVRAG